MSIIIAAWCSPLDGTVLPPGTVIGTICKHSSHLNSGLQTESNWLKNHLGLYSSMYLQWFSVPLLLVHNLLYRAKYL